MANTKNTRLEACDLLESLGIIGTDVRFIEAAEEIVSLGQDATSARSLNVHITGPSGAGKEGMAKLYAAASGRKKLVSVNCATLDANFAEDKLFGHEKGAFTGATKAHAGFFESANGGVLFLDEVCDLAPPIQTMLLRALQERKFFRIGGSKEIKVDVLIVTASMKSMDAMVMDGAFRSDLRHRLMGMRVKMPALCQRPSDIKLLADYFSDQLRVPHLDEAGWQHCLSYEWPGNVRELKDVIHRASVLSKGEMNAGSVQRAIEAGRMPSPTHSHLKPNNQSTPKKSGDGIPPKEQDSCQPGKLNPVQRRILEAICPMWAGADEASPTEWVERFEKAGVGRFIEARTERGRSIKVGNFFRKLSSLTTIPRILSQNYRLLERSAWTTKRRRQLNYGFTVE